MLEGKSVNLRVIEKEDLPFLADWSNNPEYLGEYIWLPQQSGTEWAKKYDDLTPDTKWFFIEKKDGTKIGTVFHWPIENLLEIGYVLIPNERRKGYCTEAVKIVFGLPVSFQKHCSHTGPHGCKKYGFSEGFAERRV